MIRVSLVALLLTLIPPFTVGMIVPGASLSVGVLCAAAFWMFATLVSTDRQYRLYRSDGYFLGLPLILVVLFAIHGYISNLQISGVDFQRLALSCAIFLFVFAGAHFAAGKLLLLPES